MNKLIAKSAMVGSLAGFLVRHAHAAVPTYLNEGARSAQPTGAPENLFGGPNSIFVTVANVLIFLVGAIAVIMLILGGLRYVLSSGDSAGVQSAKNTILYAIIGIIVAILAFAAVNFVIQQFNVAT